MPVLERESALRSVSEYLADARLGHGRCVSSAATPASASPRSSARSSAPRRTRPSRSGSDGATTPAYFDEDAFERELAGLPGA